MAGNYSYNEIVKSAAEKLQELNPEQKIKVQDMDHFISGPGVCVELKNFISLALHHGREFEIPEGWEIKDLPNTNTRQIIIPGADRPVGLRITDRGFNKPLKRPIQKNARVVIKKS